MLWVSEEVWRVGRQAGRWVSLLPTCPKYPTLGASITASKGGSADCNHCSSTTSKQAGRQATTYTRPTKEDAVSQPASQPWSSQGMNGGHGSTAAVVQGGGHRQPTTTARTAPLLWPAVSAWLPALYLLQLEQVVLAASAAVSSSAVAAAALCWPVALLSPGLRPLLSNKTPLQPDGTRPSRAGRTR